jgi:hypothetical protein
MVFIITIANMTRTLATLAILLLANLSAGAADLGYSTNRTPYDAYMRPVRQVLGSLEGEATNMERVQTLMRIGRGFRYSFTEPYTAALPEVTATVRAGDCKAKALWLCDQIGDENVRFVVGKARSSSRLSHAWVMWKSEGRWWILDCTNLSRPIAADSVSRNQYIPLYSWSKGGTYRHAATEFYATRAVAGKRGEPVASQNRAR